jgi:anti-anti-sigma regulatory factor
VKKKKPPRTPQLSCIELPAKLSIAQSQELHRTLTARLAGKEPLLLDGSGVEEIDTAILQLLASAWICGAERRVECQWQGASQALRDSATLIGVSEILRLDAAAGGPQRTLGA